MAIRPSWNESILYSFYIDVCTTVTLIRQHDGIAGAEPCEGESVRSLLEVLKWHSDNQITETEYTALLTEWRATLYTLSASPGSESDNGFASVPRSPLMFHDFMQIFEEATGLTKNKPSKLTELTADNNNIFADEKQNRTMLELSAMYEKFHQQYVCGYLMKDERWLCAFRHFISALTRNPLGCALSQDEVMQIVLSTCLSNAEIAPSAEAAVTYKTLNDAIRACTSFIGEANSVAGLLSPNSLACFFALQGVSDEVLEGCATEIEVFRGFCRTSATIDPIFKTSGEDLDGRSYWEIAVSTAINTLRGGIFMDSGENNTNNRYDRTNLIKDIENVLVSSIRVKQLLSGSSTMNTVLCTSVSKCVLSSICSRFLTRGDSATSSFSQNKTSDTGSSFYSGATTAELDSVVGLCTRESVLRYETLLKSLVAVTKELSLHRFWTVQSSQVTQIGLTDPTGTQQNLNNSVFLPCTTAGINGPQNNIIDNNCCSADMHQTLTQNSLSCGYSRNDAQRILPPMRFSVPEYYSSFNIENAILSAKWVDLTPIKDSQGNFCGLRLGNGISNSQSICVGANSNSMISENMSMQSPYPSMVPNEQVGQSAANIITSARNSTTDDQITEIASVFSGLNNANGKKIRIKLANSEVGARPSSLSSEDMLLGKDVYSVTKQEKFEVSGCLKGILSAIRGNHDIDFSDLTRVSSNKNNNINDFQGLSLRDNVSAIGTAPVASSYIDSQGKTQVKRPKLSLTSSQLPFDDTRAENLGNTNSLGGKTLVAHNANTVIPSGTKAQKSVSINIPLNKQSPPQIMKNQQQEQRSEGIMDTTEKKIKIKNAGPTMQVGGNSIMINGRILTRVPSTNSFKRSQYPNTTEQNHSLHSSPVQFVGDRVASNDNIKQVQTLRKKPLNITTNEIVEIGTAPNRRPSLQTQNQNSRRRSSEE